MKRYLIIGNGAAGMTAAEQIRKHDPKGSITIVSSESYPFYWRTRLNDYLAGEINEEDLIVKKEAWHRDTGLEVRLDTQATKGNAQEQSIVLANGEELHYDRLLLATGSHSFLPPIQGSELQGVFTLRTLDDAQRIRRHAENVTQAVLIGGGLLGLEAANALRKLGIRCTVVEFFPRLLPRQLDTEGAAKLQEIMEKMGFHFKLGAKTREIRGDTAGVRGVLLEDGQLLETRMVIVSAGVRPNLELADSLGVQVDKGVVVDDRMATSVENIFAAGDVANYNGMLYGIWPAAMEQGATAGGNMAGVSLQYSGTLMSTMLKVAGIQLASAGEIDAENRYESLASQGQDIYRKVVLHDDKIVGAIFLGDTRPFNRIKKMMEEKQDVATVKHTLLD